MNKSMKRREFIQKSLIAGGALALPLNVSFSQAPGGRRFGPNDTIRVATCGVNGQGGGHCRRILNIPGVKLVAICDPDTEVLDSRAARIASDGGPEVEKIQDVRRLLERDDIDAITIATPNHWHSLMAIWAVQAGKDVYVEKPISHNIWEGRKLVEAAEKYGAIVQAGTQWRSSEAYAKAFEYIKEGHIGKVLYVHGTSMKTGNRGSIGNASGPLQIPDTVDFDLWAGPGSDKPPVRERLHYDWHWFWETGCGEIGNQGIHELDASRWALGDPMPPKHVIGMGGRFKWNDDGETPNVMLSVFDFDDVPMIFEVNNIEVKDAESRRAQMNRRSTVGVTVQCEGGYFTGQGNGWIMDNDGNRIVRMDGQGPETHMPNFFDAMRSRDKSILRGDIERSHYSSVLHHTANTSLLLGKTGDPDQIAATIKGKGDAEESLHRNLEMLAKMEGVDLRKNPMTFGPWLEYDNDKECYAGEMADVANKHVKRDYREPYVIPEKV